MPVTLGNKGRIIGIIDDDGIERLAVDSKTRLVGGIGGVTGQWHWEKWADDQSI